MDLRATVAIVKGHRITLGHAVGFSRVRSMQRMRVALEAVAASVAVSGRKVGEPRREVQREREDGEFEAMLRRLPLIGRPAAPVTAALRQSWERRVCVGGAPPPTYLTRPGEVGRGILFTVDRVRARCARADLTLPSRPAMACHHVTARVVATWQARSGRRRLLRHAAERAPSGGALARRLRASFWFDPSASGGVYPGLWAGTRVFTF